ncbi:glucose 1-dehydrogenase [soil metagenome]
MLALTVAPGAAGDLRLDELPEPHPGEGPVLVQGLAMGICGTDLEIIDGEYGEAPPGSDRLILGHESLGTVLEDASGTHAAGDLVAGFVRHPDPVPCANCAVGEWDMCRNGEFTEHGIKARHGFGAQRYRLVPDRLVVLDPDLGRVGVLVEPASVVAKAWEHIGAIGARAHYTPRSVLITGAGPIGLLAALLGAQRGLDVHVLDRVTDGPKPALVADLGATYHADLATTPAEPDLVIECTGAPALILDVLARTGRNGIVCLTGVSTAGRALPLDAGGLNRELVLENDVVFGSVNANRRHYEQAARALVDADRGWLQRLISRRVPLSDYRSVFDRRTGDVKVVLDLDG